MCDSEDRSVDSAETSARRDKRHRLSMFGRSVRLPENQIVRIGIGVLLVFGGFLGFMPVLGIWMLPLGIAVLSIDIPIVRRYSMRALIWFRRRYPKAAAKILPRSR